MSPLRRPRRLRPGDRVAVVATSGPVLPERVDAGRDNPARLGPGSRARPAPVCEVLVDRLGGLGVPIVAELGFGHWESGLTVPLGTPAVLDADAATLTAVVPALTEG